MTFARGERVQTEQSSDWHALLDPNVDFPPSLRVPPRVFYTTRLRGGDTLGLTSGRFGTKTLR